MKISGIFYYRYFSILSNQQFKKLSTDEEEALETNNEYFNWKLHFSYGTQIKENYKRLVDLNENIDLAFADEMDRIQTDIYSLLKGK